MMSVQNSSQKSQDADFFSSSSLEMRCIPLLKDAALSRFSRTIEGEKNHDDDGHNHQIEHRRTVREAESPKPSLLRLVTDMQRPPKPSLLILRVTDCRLPKPSVLVRVMLTEPPPPKN
jgi:hypothetical protein